MLTRGKLPFIAAKKINEAFFFSFYIASFSTILDRWVALWINLETIFKNFCYSCWFESEIDIFVFDHMSRIFHKDLWKYYFLLLTKHLLKVNFKMSFWCHCLDQNTNKKIWQTSAQKSKKWWNQQSKGTNTIIYMY